MTDIQPFGSNDDLASPIDIGQQIFLGLTVVSVDCNSSWDEQGGQCTIKLVQDDNQYLENVVVGSPQFFEIVDNNHVPIFRFYGILTLLERSVSTSSKSYNAVLQSPTILLEACALITNSFAGYGGSLEAVGANVPQCLDYGANNSTLNVNNLYNVLNLFGVYENSSYGFQGAGFGRSVVNSDGMRIDLFANAVNELLNGNPEITPELGSNIIYGADGYTNNNAFAYNFDIYGFLESSNLANLLPSDYRIRASTLLEFIDQVCSDTNHIYYIDLLKPVGQGNTAFGTGHISTRIPLLTHSGTTYGGQVVVIVQNRSISADTKFPLSSYVVGREKSDKLGGVGQIHDLPLDIGMQGASHPDGPPVASDPLGGSFPEELINLDELQKYSETNLRVRLNTSALTARYITGGYQSRMNYVSSYGINLNVSPEIVGSTCDPLLNIPDLDLLPDVYSYWGDLNISARLGNISGDVYKNVPVITPIIDDPEHLMRDIILVDLYSLYGDLSINYTDIFNVTTIFMYNGVYVCSVEEIKRALIDFDHWKDFLTRYKPMKMRAAIAYNSRIGQSVAFDLNSNLSKTFKKLNAEARTSNIFTIFDTSSVNTNPLETFQDLEDSFSGAIEFLQSVFDSVVKMGEEHYGKSFAVKSPAFSIKTDMDYEAPLNSYINSWDLSDDAYLDPPNYGTFEAPDGIFVKGGRVSAYANYYMTHSPYHDISDARPFWYFGRYPPTRMYFSPDIAASLTPSTVYAPSFNKYTNDEVVTKLNLVSTALDVDKNYLLVPPAYFTSYYPLVSDLRIPINALLNMVIPPNGVGCVPFAKVKTKGVFAISSFLPPSFDSQADQDEAEDEAVQTSQQIDANGVSPLTAMDAIYPKSFGIPQQSNRYVYGPWVTEISLPYGGKVEHESIDSLVPESYILPANVTFGSVNSNISSGYEGLNTVGQLIANTVEGFDFLFTEEGNLTKAGYPSITHIGQALIEGGPLVSDISISVDAGQITTQYNMSTYAPKFGRANKYIVDKLSKIAKRLQTTREK